MQSDFRERKSYQTELNIFLFIVLFPSNVNATGLKPLIFGSVTSEEIAVLGDSGVTPE
jgi:hypothetical protein